MVAGGLTLTELADRTGLDPADLRRIAVERLPPATLGRLAEALAVALGIAPGRDDDEETDDRQVVGAYLAEFHAGLTPETLAEGLAWPLARVERALVSLDQALGPIGMRLRATGDRVAIGGRHEHTDRRSRAAVERLNALPTVDHRAAFLVWQALAGMKDHLVDDHDAFRAAVRHGLVHFRQARLRPTYPVEFSLRLHEW